MTKPTLLHPMGVLEMILHSMRASVRHLPSILALTVLIYVPPLTLILAGVALLGYLMTIEAATSAIIAAALVAALGALSFFVAIFYLYAAMTLAVSLHILGLKAGPVQILRRLRGSVAVQLCGTSFLSSLLMLGGMLLLLVPGVILFVRYAFVVPVVVLERVPYTAALRRSRELVHGFWWRIFGALLLLSMASYLAAFILGLVFSIPIAIAGFSINEAYNLGYGIGSVIILPVSFAFGFTLCALLYYDIRIRKEALNVDIIREAL